MMNNFLYQLVRENNISKPLFICYCAIISLTFYFVFIALFGENGVTKFLSLSRQIENKEVFKQELLSKVRTKKVMIDGMNPESLDLDLVDEQSRKVLGYVGKDEVVVYAKSN